MRCAVFQLPQDQIRRFLNDALDGQSVPVAIPIAVPEGMYEGAEMWLPEIRVLLVLWMRFTDTNYITGVQVRVTVVLWVLLCLFFSHVLFSVFCNVLSV